MPSSWYPLKLDAEDHLPALLISTAFEPSSYVVHLTDLTYIWSESLDHDDIIRRSEKEKTSIDPSDRDQLAILLEKVKSGLEGETNTTLALKTSGDGQPTITLHITVRLPGGLAPLNWQIKLEPAPQLLLTNQLTIPLLQTQHERMREVADLITALKEKDHVIQKLMDKLDAQGTDIEQVFPHAGWKGGRKADRKRAEEKVRGLGAFDIEKWRGGLEKEPWLDGTSLIESVFAKGLLLAESKGTAAGIDNWWAGIQGITVSNTKSELKASARPQVDSHQSLEDDDDFQVQATPPGLSKNPRNAHSLDSSTDSDDDLPQPSQQSQIQHSFPISPPSASQNLISSPRPVRKLGKVGGQREAPKAASMDVDTESEGDLSQQHDNLIGEKELPIHRQVKDDDSTEDEATASEKSSPVRLPTSSPSKVSPVKPKGKLGKIGGKREPPREPTPPTETSKPKRIGQIGRKNQTPSSPHEATISGIQSSPVDKKKIGAIGHKKKALHADIEGDEDEPRGREVLQKEKTPPRETSEERAEKRRNELKRELETKAKAPVKKKRKF
jgi:hypothetical protein